MVGIWLHQSGYIVLDPVGTYPGGRLDSVVPYVTIEMVWVRSRDGCAPHILLTKRNGEVTELDIETLVETPYTVSPIHLATRSDYAQIHVPIWLLPGVSGSGGSE